MRTQPQCTELSTPRGISRVEAAGEDPRDVSSRFWSKQWGGGVPQESSRPSCCGVLRCRFSGHECRGDPQRVDTSSAFSSPSFEFGSRPRSGRHRAHIYLTTGRPRDTDTQWPWLHRGGRDARNGRIPHETCIRVSGGRHATSRRARRELRCRCTRRLVHLPFQGHALGEGCQVALGSLPISGVVQRGSSFRAPQGGYLAASDDPTSGALVAPRRGSLLAVGMMDSPFGGDWKQARIPAWDQLIVGTWWC